MLVLDAGTGIRRLGAARRGAARRVHVLLSHFHMDHIQGLGFFDALFDPEVETHVWGPARNVGDLRDRLVRYLSPPLFPVHLRDLPNLRLHDVPCEPFSVGEFRVRAERVCHPGWTVGYRIEAEEGVLAYLSDHEPALGVTRFPPPPDWTSGYELARGADLLLHDAQYSLSEYPAYVGWGHSAIDHALAFARLAGVRHLVTCHHDPEHSDDDIDRLTAEAADRERPPCPVTPGAEGAVFDLGAGT